jgi:hypothetical protein
VHVVLSCLFVVASSRRANLAVRTFLTNKWQVRPSARLPEPLRRMRFHLCSIPSTASTKTSTPLCDFFSWRIWISCPSQAISVMIQTFLVCLRFRITPIMYVYNDIQVRSEYARNSRHAARKPVQSSLPSVGMRVKQPIPSRLSLPRPRILYLRYSTTDSKVSPQLDN